MEDAGSQVLLEECSHTPRNGESGCERGCAASAANSLAKLVFFNGLLEQKGVEP